MAPLAPCHRVSRDEGSSRRAVKATQAVNTREAFCVAGVVCAATGARGPLPCRGELRRARSAGGGG
jgi:hypothetical protein